MRRAQVNQGSQPVRNLFTNSGLETLSGAQVVIRTNLATDPRATALNAAANGGWKGSRWFGPAPAAGAYSLVTGAVDGPIPEITTYARKTWTVSGTASPGDTGFEHTGGTNTNVNAGMTISGGTTYTFSSYLRSSAAGKTNANIGIFWHDAAGNWISTGSSTPVAMTAGQWLRVSLTATSPANAASVGIVSDVDSGTFWQAGDTLDGTGLLIETGDALRSWFAGDSGAFEDFTYAWSGTANNSTSQLRAPGIKNAGGAGGGRVAHSSTQWSSSGTRSIRVRASSSQITNGDTFGDIGGLVNGYVFKPNTLYTIAGTCRTLAIQAGTLFGSARGFRVNVGTDLALNYTRTKSNTPGVERVVATFVTPAVPTMNFIRVHNGASETSGNLDVWWDDLFLAEGDWTGIDHIDGNKPFAKWDGTANDSTSVGYPPQLLDLAGVPELDLTTQGTATVILPDTFGLTEARTFYTVFNNIQDVASGVFTFLAYGGTDLTDTVPNSNLGLRQESTAGLTNTIRARRTGGAGPYQTNVVLGANVACWGLDNTGSPFMQNNNAAEMQESFPMAVPHQKINFTATGYHTHTRTIMYRGKHDAATRQAVSRYLGNKYGANVA